MANYQSVGEVAQDLDVSPRAITTLFYEREVRTDLAPIVGGRRLVPPELVPAIRMALRRKGIAVRDPEPAAEGKP